MGSKCRDSYADIFMGGFERNKIYPKINDKHLGYSRFKDDIFLIWTAGEKALLAFIDKINSVHPSIKFEVKYSKTCINFLDCNIHISPSGHLSTVSIKNLRTATRTCTTRRIIPTDKWKTSRTDNFSELVKSVPTRKMLTMQWKKSKGSSTHVVTQKRKQRHRN